MWKYKAMWALYEQSPGAFLAVLWSLASTIAMILYMVSEKATSIGRILCPLIWIFVVAIGIGIGVAIENSRWREW